MSAPDPFESVEALASFLVAEGYARWLRRGTLELCPGGRDYLLMRIAVSVNTWEKLAERDDRRPAS